MAIDDDAMRMVRRKLNVTWDDEGTAARLEDVISTVTPALAARLGLPADHEFVRGDPDMALFLSACLYEFSDALDDFWENYRRDLDQARLLHACGAGGDANA